MVAYERWSFIRGSNNVIGLCLEKVCFGKMVVIHGGYFNPPRLNHMLIQT